LDEILDEIRDFGRMKNDIFGQHVCLAPSNVEPLPRQT